MADQFVMKTVGVQRGPPEYGPTKHRGTQRLGRMMSLRRSETRRRVTSGTQDTWLTFDPENATDPFRHGFRTLEALNEESPSPEMNLHPQSSDDSEIVTYVREGTLINQDWSGGMGRIGPGEFQRTSTTPKYRHRVINGSLLNPAHVFQSCITPDGTEFEPGTEQKRFPVADREGILRIVASPDGRSGSLRIHQDVQMYSSILLVGNHLIHVLAPGRAAWLHIVKGRVSLLDHFLGTGDAMGVENEDSVSFTAQSPSEILLFNLA